MYTLGVRQQSGGVSCQIKMFQRLQMLSDSVYPRIRNPALYVDPILFSRMQARTPADAAEVSFLVCEQMENRWSRICAPWRSLHSGFHTQQRKRSGGKDTSAPTKRQGLAEFGCQDKHVSKFWIFSYKFSSAQVRDKLQEQCLISLLYINMCGSNIYKLYYNPVYESCICAVNAHFRHLGCTLCRFLGYIIWVPFKRVHIALHYGSFWALFFEKERSKRYIMECNVKPFKGYPNDE